MNTKKLLGTTLALAMTIPSFGIANAAELFKNLKLSGQIDVDATSARNVLDFSTRQNFAPTAAANTGATAAANSGNDRVSNVQTRLMLSLDWDLLDDVHSKITLTKNDRSWGTVGGTGSGENANSQPLGTGGAGNKGGTSNVLGSVYIDQAYFKVDKVFGGVDTTVGRQYYGEAGDSVIYIGPSDKPEYGNPTNAIDAARFDWSNDQFGVTGLAGQAAGQVAAVPAATIDITGLVLSWKGNENASGNIYTWNRETHATGALGQDPSQLGLGAGNQIATGKNDNLYVTGAKIKLHAAGAWFNGQFDKNWGDNRVGGNITNTNLSNSMRYKGWEVLADAGYKADVSGVGTITPWGSFGFGTGQHDAHSNEGRGFQAISGDYRPGAIYGRFAPYTNGGAQPVGLGATSLGGNGATNSLTNRVITGLGLKVTPDAVKKLTVGVSVWDFHTQTVAAPVLPMNGAAALGVSSVANGQSAFNGNKHIGYEEDIEFGWKHSDNVNFGVTAGRFMPGGIISEGNQATGTQGALKNAAGTVWGVGTNPAVLVAFDARVKF